jgi:hypothetical protein
MNSVRHKAILKSWIETGLLSILTKHIRTRDMSIAETRAIVDVEEFLNYLKWNHVRDWGKLEFGQGRIELFVVPDRSMEQWAWAFDLACDEPYFAQVDNECGWRFRADPDSGDILIERFDTATEAKA